LVQARESESEMHLDRGGKKPIENITGEKDERYEFKENLVSRGER
jgi:hypothetical protein